MSGHNKWQQIKHQKGITDKKRGAAFSKLLAAIAVAAKSEPNPDFNPRLRTAIEAAKEQQVPAANIARAVARASESAEGVEELLMEAYGPGGIAILIEAATDNRNRTIHELQHLIAEHGGKWAESRSVTWAFEPTADSRGTNADQRGNSGIVDKQRWRAKFPQEISASDRAALSSLIAAIEKHGDVQHVSTNANL